MKKKAVVDVKKLAAHDVEPPAPAKKASKRSKPDADTRYVLGTISTVKRGFLAMVVAFAQKKQTVDREMLITEFAGKKIEGAGARIDEKRIDRYLGYCRVHGILKEVKNGG